MKLPNTNSPNILICYSRSHCSLHSCFTVQHIFQAAKQVENVFPNHVKYNPAGFRGRKNFLVTTLVANRSLYILSRFLSFTWKVEPFCNTKFWKWNSFSRFLICFFESWNVQMRQFWDCCRFLIEYFKIPLWSADDVGEGFFVASG